MKRAAIGFFHDADGILDDYFPALVAALAAQAERIIVAVDGPLPEDARLRLIKAGSETMDVDCGGDSLRAHSQVIMALSTAELDAYDEVLFFDHSFFGPIFPFEELFARMAGRPCDLWSITGHNELDWNVYGGAGPMPFHIDPNFIVFRGEVLRSADFAQFWDGNPASHDAAGQIQPWVFSRFFVDRGYRTDALFGLDAGASFDPAYFDIPSLLSDHYPILERRLFLTDPTYGEYGGADLARALRLIEERSDYDTDLIWKNVIRLGQARVLATNASMIRILPDTPMSDGKSSACLRIAVCIHVYYLDMLEDLLLYASNIPGRPDLILTTDGEEKKRQIERFLADRDEFGRATILELEENRGRDMSALFISCRDFFLGDKYDLVCRIHSKRTPQIQAARSNIFRYHMYENVLHSRGFVTNLIDLFLENPRIGLAIPPIIHMSLPTLGHSWFSNKEMAQEVAKKLDLSVKLDESTPVAPYGTMFWFRPKALTKLFQYPWRWSDFNAEPNHVDGGLAHVLERLIAYVAQDAGYATFHVSSTHLAEQNYAMLEWKLQTLLAELPIRSFYGSKKLLHKWAAERAED
jgi:rhamnosyltransferase